MGLTFGQHYDGDLEYQIKPADRVAFLDAIAVLAAERRRDGAFEWDVFEDLSQQGHFVETFMLDSWIEHLRQHERVTHADRELQERVNRFQGRRAEGDSPDRGLGWVGEADRCVQLRLTPDTRTIALQSGPC